MSSKDVKRKRIVLDIPTKLTILDRLDKEYGIGKSIISDIKAAKSKLRDFVVSSEGVSAGC